MREKIEKLNTAAKCLTGLLAMSLIPAALAQTLSDPTRPPAAWIAAQQGGLGGSTSVTEPEETASGLRVLVVGPKRKYAIVDGQVVKPGDTLNGAKILSITRDAVVTRGESATEALKLAPDVEKKQTAKAKASRRDR